VTGNPTAPWPHGRCVFHVEGRRTRNSPLDGTLDNCCKPPYGLELCHGHSTRRCRTGPQGRGWERPPGSDAQCGHRGGLGCAHPGHPPWRVAPSQQSRAGRPSLRRPVGWIPAGRRCRPRSPGRALSGPASPAPQPARTSAPAPGATASSSRWSSPPVDHAPARQSRAGASGAEPKRWSQRNAERMARPVALDLEGLSGESSGNRPACRSDRRWASSG
jgi:hypothetical protein